jgi:SsrA-binding protein
MGQKIISTNRKARFNYYLTESYEAGIALLGSEVKSLRAGRIDMNEGYIKIENDEIFLYNINILAYEHLSDRAYDPLRKRKLLLHSREIFKLRDAVAAKGLALVPVQIYFKGGIVKVEIALGSGKKLYDKRESIKKREMDREMERAES